MLQEELVAWAHWSLLVQQEVHCNLALVQEQQYMLALVRELRLGQQEHHR